MPNAPQGWVLVEASTKKKLAVHMAARDPDLEGSESPHEENMHSTLRLPGSHGGIASDSTPDPGRGR